MTVRAIAFRSMTFRFPEVTFDRAAEEPGPNRPEGRQAVRRAYLAGLTWAFTLFSSVRVLSYLPTLWAIHLSGDSSQHSLITWCTWLGSNLTMALWLFEQNDQRANRAVAVNLVNAAMCLVTVVLIAWHRF